MGKRDDLRKAVKACFDAVIAGEHYTLTKKGKPVAVAVPYADYQAMRAELAKLEEKLVPPSQRRLTDPNAAIPEDEWGQGDVADASEVPFRRHTEAVMATDDDEEALQQAYGKSSQELADEAAATIYTPRNEISDRFEPR